MRGVTHIDWDEILRTMSDGRRRRVVQFVRATDGPTTLEELASHLADAPESSEAELAGIRANLYHVHLPKLRDAGLVSWDGGDEVTPRSLSRELSPDLVAPPASTGQEGLGGADD